MLAAGVMSTVSCEQKSILEKVSGEFSKGNYAESVFLARHHFKKGGEKDPELLFIVGRALLKLGSEAEAADSFAEICAIDSSWATRIAGLYRVEALENLETGQEARGKRFILKTAEFGPDTDFGPYNPVAGEILLEGRDFDGAIRYFRRYLQAHPDTAGAAEVMIQLGSAYEGKGDKLHAIELYRRFQDRYPGSRLMSTVEWKLENLLLNAGTELYSGGEIEKAQALLLELADSAGNPLVREKVNFLLAEIFESRNETESAVDYYSRVVHMNLGSSGRLVERAKERIAKLEKQRSGR
jgi:tetratricopeptide (TPR) repeat protein